MKITYDKEVDAAYLHLGEPTMTGGVHTVPVPEVPYVVNLDFDAAWLARNRGA
jgi:uncharacterized protein YuzE